ncbi:group-specific protein [Jeotgalibacillus proteolyticus]|uniref:Group-specific protein n=1 Tax=Jeotgalibacillus proteolyticus TaxID=2082395 RepID=A0A2S5G8H7_9BACL|nr:group-specific protein [Jeotgalibacillus proteolyticus]PPA69302.1 group-specific protein [Jeotgalibacillus proteolyticus]
MGKCSIDHTKEDTKSKLESQHRFLSEELYQSTLVFLKQDVSQEDLNELFHLLKKYDLASEEEQEQRAVKLKMLVG